MRRISFNVNDAMILLAALDDHYCEIGNMQDDNAEYLAVLKQMGARLTKFIDANSKRIYPPDPIHNCEFEP